MLLFRRFSILVIFLFLVFFASSACADIVISEVMTSNGVYTNDGEAYDWIELHNTGSKAVDISGYYLSDKAKKPTKWAFPANTTIKANGYILVYCTGEEMSPGKNGTYYANFKLSSSGENVYLTDKDGETTVFSLSIPAQYGNVSWGIPEGKSEYLYFAEATPGKPNAKEGYPARSEKPVIQTPGGFYDAAVTVFAFQEEDAALRYTLDGSTPTQKSSLFPADGLTFSKTAVLRVRAFGEGEVPSETVAATYILGQEQPVPVISLITDEKYLFDKKTGLLVKGASSSYPNYEHDWEYPVNIEYFNLDGECEINQMGTFTTAGHSARQNAQKTIAIYARKAYGPGEFSFNPFPNRDYESYKSLLLRGANSDAFSTRLRDPVISSLAEPLGIIYQDALAIEVYINGEYWGHYNLREKINKYFVAQWENVTDEKQIDQIDILARTGRDNFVQNGSNEDWLALCEFCRKKDLNDPENLQYVLDNLDIDSLFTHTAFEIIIGNNDFTNVRVYRVPDGKWKYLLFDVEAGFLSMDSGPMNYYIKKVSDKIQGFRHEPLAALLNVPEMKARFLTRFAQVLELSFQWDYVDAHFQPWEELLETLLPRHLARWPHFTMQAWRQNVDAVKYYARVRPVKIVAMLQKHMKLTDAEVEQYFGKVQTLLESKNILK
ncbi:MAG: CotH kinase family protein [Clostridia bacterium]|nr:CotH kinase family protein [Clostridia bacterium]